jgi:hypothetical protein
MGADGSAVRFGADDGAREGEGAHGTRLPETLFGPNETLFSYCTRWLPPDWSQVTGVSVIPVSSVPANGGVTAQGGETAIDLGWLEPEEIEIDDLAYEDRHEAVGWVVYGAMRDGAREPLTQVNTERQARTIKALFDRRLRIEQEMEADQLLELGARVARPGRVQYAELDAVAVA